MLNTKYISLGLDFFSNIPELGKSDEMKLFSDTLKKCTDAMYKEGICKHFTTEEIKEHFSIFDENQKKHPIVLDNIKEQIKAYYVSLGCLLLGSGACETVRSYQVYEDHCECGPSDVADGILREKLSEIMEYYSIIPKQVAVALSDYFGRCYDRSADLYAGEFMFFVVALHYECNLYREMRIRNNVPNYNSFIDMLKIEKLDDDLFD